MSKAIGEKIAVKFTQDLLFISLLEDVLAFRFEWQEYKYVNGPVIDKSCVPMTMELHSTEDRTVLLTVDNLDRFYNAMGDITVVYDDTIGNIAGDGGKAKSFSVAFTPADLFEIPHPHEEDHITVGLSSDLDFIEVFYQNAYEEENITVGLSATVDFIDVTIVNP